MSIKISLSSSIGFSFFLLGFATAAEFYLLLSSFDALEFSSSSSKEF